MHETPTQKLLHILEAERQAVISADFEKVRHLEKEKLNYFSQGSLGSVSPVQAASIQDALARNQALLQAAIGGVKQARERVSQLQEVSKGLRVYDQNGQLAQINSGNSGVDRQS